MKLVWNWIAGLSLLAITAVGCGGGGSIGLASSDGGPVGSGLSATVSGNVVSVAPGSEMAAASGTGAAMMVSVHVSIDEVPGAESTTDADGNFELEGDFSGTLTLRFKTAMFEVTEGFDVPAGSTIVLEDVQLAPGMVQMGVARQLGFAGVVAHVDCGAGVLLVNDRRPTANQFMVRLSAATTIVDGNGQSLQCTAVQTGEPLIVRGAMQLDQTVVASGVIVRPQSSASVQFTGRVKMINCHSGVLLVSDPAGTPGMPNMHGMPGMAGMLGKARVRLTSSTDFTAAGGQPIQCGTVVPGEAVEVIGSVSASKPGVVDAHTVKVSTSA